MKKWVDMKYSEILKIEDKILRKKYKGKWDKAWINIINPLYNALPVDKIKEFTEFQRDNRTILELALKPKELNGGHGKARQIVFSKAKK